MMTHPEGKVTPPGRCGAPASILATAPNWDNSNDFKGPTVDDMIDTPIRMMATGDETQRPVTAAAG
jgi:hypothetical protein